MLTSLLGFGIGGEGKDEARSGYRSAFCHWEAAANLAVIGVLAPPIAAAVPVTRLR